MCTHEFDPKDSIAREFGYDSFEDAPEVVQNNIKHREIVVRDPFAALRRD